MQDRPSVAWHPPVDDGEFLVDTSVMPGSAAGDQESPAAAFDGENFLLVWHDYRCSLAGDIYGTRVSQTGVVLDKCGIAIAVTASSQMYPAVAFDGTNFLVVWEDWALGESTHPHIFGARVSPTGSVLDPTGFAVSTAELSQVAPAVEFDGANFLVVWEYWRTLGESDIYGARVSPDGRVLDSAGIAISTATSFQGHPAASVGGTDALVVWQDLRHQPYPHIYGARVSRDGLVLDPAGIAISAQTGAEVSPATTFNGADFLVVWEDLGGSGYSEIHGARVDQAGVVVDTSGFCVSAGACDREHPEVVTDGGLSLVVWRDYVAEDTSFVRGARVNQLGSVIDTLGIAISSAGYEQCFPVVASGDEDYFTAWQDLRRDGAWDVNGVRVSHDGIVLDSPDVNVSTAATTKTRPAAAYDGTNFLAVWQDRRGDSSWDIHAVRVNRAGVVLDPPGVTITTTPDSLAHPAVASDGTVFLVVWADKRGSDESHIYCARVSRAGELLDSACIAISVMRDSQLTPAVAFDGSNFLVVWEQWRLLADAVNGARVSQAGTVLDSPPIVISSAPVRQQQPRVAFDGANSFVVWTDSRSGEGYDIYGARVSQAGMVLDPAGIAVSQTAEEQSSVAVASDGTNSLVVWEEWHLGYPYNFVCGRRVNHAGVVLDSSEIAVSTARRWQQLPAVAYDGTAFLVIWQDFQSDTFFDLYGAWVSQAGVVYDSGPVVRQEGDQWHPALAGAEAGDMLLVYQGWTGTVGSKAYNAERVWGKMNPSPAVAEITKPEVRMTNGGATVVRGVLAGSRLTAEGATQELLDVVGRKVLTLNPGPNDVSRLSPGVYFCRFSTADGSRMQKVAVLGR